tara:strand:- start:6340 stop:8295 length:1956 start_codon:yes stop_codon:yes gene_type:complete
MAYGLRYTITQILRNGNNQLLEIYERDYVAGVVKTYKPVSIIVQPNSNEEYPYPTIISTQVNFSILLETQDDYDQFPNVLSQDDRKYYVVLKESTNVMWRGFLFNDYTQMGFSTGITQADFTCIDGLSFIQNIQYVRDDSINQLDTQLNIISTGLRLLSYPDVLNLVVACSYFAGGMNDRQDAVSNEPFSQIYQYRRDFVGESYYEIIGKIMTSFNCRMFQANGDWWICSMNEMAASTNYYTEYDILSTPTITSSGVLNNTVNIVPYADGNVHFINNSQIKLLKKGFYNIQGRGAYESALNYCDNADLKLNAFPTNTATGFILGATGDSTATIVPDTTGQFDAVSLVRNTSGLASIENGNLAAPNYFLPYIGEVPFKLSFEHITSGTPKLQIQLITSGGTRYLDTNGQWQSSVQNLTIDASNNVFSTYSKDIPPYIVSSVQIFGYLKFKIICDLSGQASLLQNFIIQRGDSEVKFIEANFVADNTIQSTLKVFEQPYGNNYPTNYTYSSNKGVLCASDGTFLENWYSSCPSGTPIGAVDLITYMTYQNIRNVNKNVATVECDLGEHTSDVGFVYLDKVFTTTDTVTGNLSYTGKKFIMNRVSQNAYVNELNSVQLIEVSFAEINAFIIPNYITDTGQLGPFWIAQFNINIV